MKISVQKAKVTEFSCAVLILGLFEDQDLDEYASLVDEKLDKGISYSIHAKEFVPEFGKSWMVHTFGKVGAKNVLLVGLGKRSEFDMEKLRRAAGFSSKIAREVGSVVATAMALVDVPGIMISERASAVAQGVLLGLYRFDQYKTVGKDKQKHVSSLTILADSVVNAQKAQESLQHELVVCDMTNFARDLVNQPPSMMTPIQMAVMAKKIVGDKKIKLKVFDRDEIVKMGFGGLFAVSKGSTQEPRFIVLEYRNPKAKKTVALVGKGVTFDSGGLDIKPASGMEDMKVDMAGAAAVMAVSGAVAALRIPINLIVLMPCTENMPGGSAYKPGDIIKTYSKKTIEILNTDAEGRVVLSDALAYAEKQYKPDAIIDLATLTGACIVALGTICAGLVSSDDHLADRIKVAAMHSGERVWQLPLYDEFKDAVKSQVADVKNIGLPKGEAGACTAAAFLSSFVEKTPWAHLDIAGPAYITDERDYIPKGGTGFGVRLLIALLEDWARE
ncbi:MAG: leucyl aminopeptidase [Nanoarchaeota archaeon]